MTNQKLNVSKFEHRYWFEVSMPGTFMLLTHVFTPVYLYVMNFNDISPLSQADSCSATIRPAR